MSGKFGGNRKRREPSSTIKMKRFKGSDCMNDEISEDNHSQEKMKVKKLVTLSQPTLRSDLKMKLHSLLSNWKPPLKNLPNENHEVCIMKTDSNQESHMKLVKCDDTLSESKQLQKVSHTNPAMLQFDIQEENSINNENCNLNNNLEQTSVDQYQESYNTHKPSTTINQQLSESSTLEICNTVDFNEQKTNEVLVHDTSEVIIKNENSDTKCLEDSANEQETILYSKESTGFSTPEVTRTPPTPPTLKISWLKSNGYDVSPSNSKDFTQNEDSEELPNLNEKSSNESDTFNEAELIKHENCDELTKTKKLELETLIEHSVDNSFKTECEFNVNILHSQLNSKEKNPSTSRTQKDQAQELNTPRELTQELNPPRELVHELNPPRELVHEVNPPRELAQELTNFDFTPFYPAPLAPKMPRLNWVHQLQEDKKQLQAVVREISQLKEINNDELLEMYSAMMTRAVREIWSARNTH